MDNAEVHELRSRTMELVASWQADEYTVTWSLDDPRWRP
jgi:hypothetical protein